MLKFNGRGPAAIRVILVGLWAAAFLISCDASPTAPTGRVRSGDPVVSGVQIIGPREVPPGLAVQLILAATFSDGTTRDVTTEANWTSADGQIASIAGPGYITGGGRGTAMIEARFGGHQARREMHVVPAGTFALKGRVNHRASRDVPITGARIEVTSGTGTGLVSITNSEGFFSLFGVSGSTTLRVTRDGYSPVTHTVVAADHQSITIELSLSDGHADVSGVYTLTIAAATECGVGVGEANLPDEIRVRAYAATVQQRGANLWVDVSGPGFSTEFPQGFGGVLEAGGAMFWVRNADDGQPITERLSTSRVLGTEGRVVATINPAGRIEGALSGELRLFDTATGPWKSIAWCSSSSHRFVLSR